MKDGYVMYKNRSIRMLRQILLCIVMLSAGIPAVGQDTLRHEVLLQTNKGNIRISLYNETPLHRDNFLKNVREGWYDGLLFHRVISNFMIQMGDTASRHAGPGQLLGETSETYTVPAEFRCPQIYHKRGAVAAAREGDADNPERSSSMSQFYIVYGIRYNDAMLDKTQQKLDVATGGKVRLTPEMRETYRTLGGTPHLDGQYTVFGEVTEGMDVVESIQGVQTDSNARPLEDIRIEKATVVK